MKIFNSCLPTESTLADKQRNEEEGVNGVNGVNGVMKERQGGGDFNS